MTERGAVPVERTSADIKAERVGALRELFPEAFSEGRVDFDKLRQALGDVVDDRPERSASRGRGSRGAG